MILGISREIRALLKKALQEDLGRGDLTTETLIPREGLGEAAIFAREPGIFAGGPVASEVFHLHDRSLRVKLYAREGVRVKKGQKILTVRGHLRSLLEAERVALNFLSHLSGIATLARRFVEKVRGTPAQIFDTRKTTPLWRTLEKYAVRTGGGENHRFGLWDEILVKGNHWKAGLSPGSFRALARTKRRRKTPVEIEVRHLRDLAYLLEGPFVPDRILLDNFSLPGLRRAVLFVRGFHRVLRARYGIRRKIPILEASGRIHLGNVRAVARTGVDRISVGRITHSAPALDFSLELTSVVQV